LGENVKLATGETQTEREGGADTYGPPVWGGGVWEQKRRGGGDRKGNLAAGGACGETPKGVHRGAFECHITTGCPERTKTLERGKGIVSVGEKGGSRMGNNADPGRGKENRCLIISEQDKSPILRCESLRKGVFRAAIRNRRTVKT